MNKPPKRVRTIVVDGDVAYVPLANGEKAIIDALYVPLVEGRPWRQVTGGGRVVTGSHRDGNQIPLTFVLTATMSVRYKNGNVLDNLVSNLIIPILEKQRQIDQSLLKECLDYRDGKFFWKVTAGTATKGAEAGCRRVRPDTGRDEVVMSIGKRFVGRASCVWIWHNGSIPMGARVAHKNRDPLDDRIENLELSTHRAQCQNTKSTRRRHAKYGAGVYRKGRTRYEARITANGVRILIGTYKTPDEAIEARQRVHEATERIERLSWKKESTEENR